MHRRLQFGMRENPASDRRHGSRFVVDSTQFSNYAEENDSGRSSLAGQNESVAIISPNAAHRAATGGGSSLPAAEGAVLEYRQRSVEAFEPLISSGQAARLLGNIHVKTLQRYARLGRLPGYQIGGHWYFRESELDAWLRHQINSKCQSVR
jgi:excisionase family DNA binding protein